MAMNTASSIQGVDVSRSPLPIYIERQMTILGWYENLRMANYFDDQTLKRIAEPGEDFELRLADDAKWQFTPVSYRMHRVGSDQYSLWNENNPFQSQSLCMRILALENAVDYDDAKAVVLLDPDSADELEVRQAASSVALANKSQN